MSIPVRFLTREPVFPSADLEELRDCNDLLEDVDELHARFAEDGYLLVRGLHERGQVLAARAEMLTTIRDQGVLDPGSPLDDGRLLPGSRVSGRGLDRGDELLKVVEGAPILEFFKRYFAGDVRRFDFTWARAVPNGGATGAHVDAVYMGRGSRRLMTCWTPLGDIDTALGGLAVCVGSHRLDGFRRLRQTYGRMDVDRDVVNDWFTSDPGEITERFGGRWATTEFRAGDVVLFGMFTLHASLTNTTDRLRLSADTRYQPAAEPADDRWVRRDGKDPTGHTTWLTGKQKPMTEARAAWGI